MLSRSKKINTQLFKEVLNKGKIYNFPYFSIKVSNLLVDDPQSKFTCVISKKVIKKAVQRNLFKRRFFSIVQKKYKELSGNRAVIFFLKKGGEQLSFDDLEKEILSIFKKIGLEKKE